MQNYHKHSCYSESDSAAMLEDYAKRAVELGQKVLSSVEHGWQGYYYGCFELAKKYNLKFVFGTEAYWVKDRKEQDKTNAHIIILAKNENGRRAINRILSDANETGFYYKPRVDLELLLSLPKDDVFLTSACIAFWKYDDSENIAIKLHNYFGDNFLLEIQAHATEAQKELSRRTKEISQKYGIKMIAGLDSHYIYPEESVERDDILAGRNIKYDDSEAGWYMDYPDEKTTMERFLEQGVFSKEEIQAAMDASDVLLEFKDYNDNILFKPVVKMPTLYPDKTQAEKNKIYSELISRLFSEYMKNIPEDRYQEYFEGVKKEVSTYKETNMVDYPLIDYEIVKKAVEKGGLITSTGRGSAVGFMTNTLCGFSKVDRFTSPIKLYPERFISKTRILETNSLPDLDLNTGNPDVFAEAQKEVLGDDHAYPMIAFGTLKKKSAFKLYARAAKMDFELANEISAQISKYDEALKNAEDDNKDDIDIFDFVDKKYEDYIKKSQKYWGVIDHKNKAPCAYLLYGGSIREEIGLIRCKSDATGRDYITTVIDGAIAENYKFLKNDLLKVDVVYMIDKMFKRINKPILSTTELSNLVENDTAVWDLYANAYTIGVNQCEGEGSKQKLKRYKPRNISELCAWIAAIRPAFKSMYNKFESREPFEYGIPAFDNILQTPQFPYSFVLYQEQTMNTLNYAGFPLDECYGIIKAIAKKHPEKVKPLKERFLNGFKEKILKENNISESEADDMSAKVWQIINDSCGYGFNSAHAYCMALDSLYCAWLKVHYTYEFYEVLMQMYSDKGNKDKVQALKAEMKKAFGIKEGPYKWGVDNRRFVADKNNGLIYPSLLSLKGFSQGCADALYEMAQNKKYDNFLDLVKDLTENKKDINSSRLDILIRLGYFSEFGPAKTLLKTVEYYDKYQCAGKTKQFKKDSLPLEAIPYIETYAIKETDKQYVLDTDGVGKMLLEIVHNIPNEEIPLKDRLAAESEYLGYIATTIPDAQGNAFITNLEMKGNNFRISLYDLGTGEGYTVKLKKKTYQTTPINTHDIITYKLGEEHPWYKDENGKWQQDFTKEPNKILQWYGKNNRWD